jgi:hypothetical protein
LIRPLESEAHVRPELVTLWVSSAASPVRLAETSTLIKRASVAGSTHDTLTVSASDCDVVPAVQKLTMLKVVA